MNSVSGVFKKTVNIDIFLYQIDSALVRDQGKEIVSMSKFRRFDSAFSNFNGTNKIVYEKLYIDYLSNKQINFL